MRTVCALMVMPRARSRAIASSTCAGISRAVSEPVSSSNRSESVDLPWSMCAMIAKSRINLGSMLWGRGKSPEPLGYQRRHGSVIVARPAVSLTSDLKVDLNIYVDGYRFAVLHRRLELVLLD